MLRGRYPDAQIDVLVRSSCEVMLQSNPDVDAVVGVGYPDKSKRTFRNGIWETLRAVRALLMRRYDYAFDLSESDRAKTWMLLSGARKRCVNDVNSTLRRKGWMVNRISKYAWGNEHQVMRDFQTVLDCMGIDGEPGPLRFHPQIDEAEIGLKLPFVAKLDDYAVLHPTSRWPFKQWLPERWAEVADRVKRDFGLEVVISCGPDEREKEMVGQILKHAKERHLSTGGRIDLHELGWLLGRARLFLGVDTVAMHLAAAMQTPIVALFGPSSEWSWRPWKCRHELVLGGCECKETRQFICDKSKPYPCMEAIQVGQVLSAAQCLLSSD
jgi:heptosyltransferase-3